MEEKDIEKITKLISLASVLVTGVMKLSSLIADIVRENKNISEENKEELIKKIKSAQTSVPEWGD